MPPRKVSIAIQKMRKAYLEVLASLARTKYWYTKYDEDIQATHKKRVEAWQFETSQFQQQNKQQMAALQYDLEATIHNTQQTLSEQVAQISRHVYEVEQALGFVALPWHSPIWQNYSPVYDQNTVSGLGRISSVPGGLRIGTIQQSNLSQPISASALIPLIKTGHILITSSRSYRSQALELLQSMVTRIAVTFPPLSARFSFVDPTDIGNNFPFKRLSDRISGDTIYHTTEDIRKQLGELVEHISRITTKYLARDFSTIEEYNLRAKEITEPYRFLCIADFPAKFDTESLNRLVTIAERGVKTGVYIIMHMDVDILKPRDLNMSVLERVMQRIAFENGTSPTFPLYSSIPQAGNIAEYTQYSFSPDQLPSPMLFNALLDKVSKASEKHVFRGIEFGALMAPEGTDPDDPDQWWQGSTESLLESPIGRSGAIDTLNFWLGQRPDGRWSSNALIAGSSGSGKSNLFHVLINSLALLYSPDELQLFLVDFKEGLEFTPYAHALPHARAIAIESEREFGLSILQKMAEEITRRASLFKEAGVTNITDYRRKGQSLPRLLLIFDEFHVLFGINDVITSQSNLALESIVKQGRALGIHIVMGSQTLSGSNIPKPLIDQFATRIALKISESEAAVILRPDNISVISTLERPGELIYNDGVGARERNQPGQVANIGKPDESIPKLMQRLDMIAKRKGYVRQTPQTIFNGRTPSELKDNLQLEALYQDAQWVSPRAMKEKLKERDWSGEETPVMLWLGEAVRLKPHTGAILRRRSRNNLIIIGNDEMLSFGMIGSILLSIPIFLRPNQARFYLIDLSLKDEFWDDTCENFQKAFSSMYPIEVKERRQGERLLESVYALFKEKQERYKQGQEELGESIFLVVAGAQRMAELQPVPGRSGEEPSEHMTKLSEIIRHGPALGVHVIMWIDSEKNFDVIFGRAGGKAWIPQFDWRVVLPMDSVGSQYILNDPAASTLKPLRALLREGDQGSLEKFKPYALPEDRLQRLAIFENYADLLRRRAQQ